MLVRNPLKHDSRVEREARTLQRAGYPVTIVCEAGEGLPGDEQRDGYRVLRVPRRGVKVIGARFLDHRRSLMRVMRATRPEILHAHDTDALEPVATLAAGLRIPFVYDAHELWLERARRGRSRGYHWLSQLYYAAVQRVLIPRAAAVMVANPPVGPHLARQYRIAEPDAVPNYPDRVEIGPPCDLRTLPGGDAIRSGMPIVLYLGGLMPDRGIELLVRAVAEVSGLQLVFMGSGSHRAAIGDLVREQRLEDRTTFLDPVAPTQVIGYASSAQIGVSVLPPTSLNNQYSLPNKLFQCMAAGLAMVASDFPQVREVVVGSGAGVVVDTSDLGALGSALRRLAEHPEERGAMGSAARRAVLERYNWDRSAALLGAVYARVEAARRDG